MSQYKEAPNTAPGVLALLALAPDDVAFDCASFTSAIDSSARADYCEP